MPRPPAAVGSAMAALGAAIAYPHLLAAFHAAHAAHLQAPAVAALAAAFGMPLLGFAIASHASAIPPTRAWTRVRRLGNLLAAAPPLYTFMGVVLYLMRIEGADLAVWNATWLLVAAAVAIAWTAGGDHPVAPSRSPGWIRIAHGVSAAVLAAGFLLPHLANHVAGLGGAALHERVASVLRGLYRAPAVEPALLGLLAFQGLTGAFLWSARTREPGDALDALQSLSGAFLLAYLASHVNSVFVLARHFGIETTWAWATGMPTGLAADPWTVRLIPHYTLAVALLGAHLACGVRGIARAHGAPAAAADRVAWALVGASALLAAVIAAAMLAARP